jgi:hypothetical protein
MKAFKWLLGSVTSLAIDKLRNEWKVINATIANEDIFTPWDYEMLRWYSLPWKRFLLKVAQNGSPIPRSFLHPDGGSIALLLDVPLGRTKLVFEQREHLNTEERPRLDD